MTFWLKIKPLPTALAMDGRRARQVGRAFEGPPSVGEKATP